MPEQASYESLLKRIEEMESENRLLRDKEETARFLLNAPADTVLLLNNKGIIIDSNKAAADRFGIDHEKFIGSCFWDYFPPDAAQIRKARVDKVFETGESVRYEDERDNTWHDTIIYPIVEGKKKTTKIAILSHDITGHKQIEDLLRFQRDLGMYLSTSRDLTETLTQVLDSILDIEGIDAGGIYLIDEHTGSMDLVVHKNLPPEFVKISNHYEADMPQTVIIMNGIPLYWDYAEAASTSKTLARLGEFKAVAIIPIRFKDMTVGSLTLISQHYDDIPINARIALETIAARIGGVIVRLKAEDMLRKYELIVSTVHDSMSFIDSTYTYKAVNNALMRAFDTSREEIVGHSVAELFGLEVFENKIQKHLDKALEGNEVYHEDWFDYPGWGRRYVTLSYFPYFEEDGTITGIAAISSDITDRKKTEDLLMESESRYRHLFEYANDAIVLIKDNRIINCNKKSLETFRCTKKEILNKQMRSLHALLQSDGENSHDKWQRILQSVLYDKPQFFEWTFSRFNHSDFAAEVSLNHIELKGQYYVQAIIRDITERKRREEEQIKVSKLESIGTLAGGIAHDFNNILATILGNIELAQSYVPHGDKTFARLNKAIAACNRAKELTRQFLTLSKGGAPIKKTGSLLGLIKGSCDLALSGRNVECEYTIPDELWIVEFDENQLVHAFNNIILNASQSMPEGGRVSISAKNIIMKSDTFESGVFVSKGPYIQVMIKDHGSGIPDEILPKIFDPYFSTKELGTQKGMGLGLTTAYSIIKKHGGYIFAESKIGVGTTFYVLLPAIQKEISDMIQDRQDFKSGKGNILLMDDEEMIRDTVSEMLHQLGYQVEVSQRGEEAIEKFLSAQKCGSPFDAVILDLTVRGGMGGVETMKKLKEIDPMVSGIVFSGYSDDAVMINFEKYGFIGVVVKPFNMNDLADTVQKVVKK